MDVIAFAVLVTAACLIVILLGIKWDSEVAPDPPEVGYIGEDETVVEFILRPEKLPK